MRLTILTGVSGALLFVFIVELLRRRQLQEKYAALWLIIGLAVLPLAFFPRMLDGAANALGVASGASLVFFLGFVLLLLVCVHLSWEVSRLEEETRTIAEEVALLRTEFKSQAQPGAPLRGFDDEP